MLARQHDWPEQLANRSCTSPDMSASIMKAIDVESLQLHGAIFSADVTQQPLSPHALTLASAFSTPVALVSAKELGDGGGGGSCHAEKT